MDSHYRLPISMLKHSRRYLTVLDSTGYSGYNTDFYLQLELEDLQNVTLVTIFFGANDAALPEIGAHQHVPLDRFEANLTRIVDLVRTKYDNPRILLVAPPPVVHAQRLEYQRKRYGDRATGILERTLENTGLYAKTCMQVAESMGVPCLNMYGEMQAVDSWDHYFHDGLHFSPEGHEFVFNALRSSIQTHFPDLVVVPDALTGFWANSGSSCQALSEQGPFHDRVNHETLEESFDEYKASLSQS